MKAALICGTERRHWISPEHDVSPVIADICSTVHVPTRSCRLQTRIHSVKPILSEMTSSSASLDVVSLYHFATFSRPFLSASRTVGSFMPPVAESRNCADVSRLALGRMTSLSTSESAIGTGLISSLMPKRPKDGLHRQKEMRTSIARNSYSTSSWSRVAVATFCAPAAVAVLAVRTTAPAWVCASALARACRCASYAAAVLVALALMNWLVITSNLYFGVSRPTSTTKSWNSSSDISRASSAETSEIERQ